MYELYPMQDAGGGVACLVTLINGWSINLPDEA